MADPRRVAQLLRADAREDAPAAPARAAGGMLPASSCRASRGRRTPRGTSSTGCRGPCGSRSGSGGASTSCTWRGPTRRSRSWGAEPYVNGIAALLGSSRPRGVGQRPRASGGCAGPPGGAAGGSPREGVPALSGPLAQGAAPPAALRDAGPLGLLATAMGPGAELRVATDIEDYVRQTLEEVPAAGFVLERGPVVGALGRLDAHPLRGQGRAGGAGAPLPHLPASVRPQRGARHRPGLASRGGPL
jgi:hypothetical protein